MEGVSKKPDEIKLGIRFLTSHQGLFLEKVFPNFPNFFQKYFSKNLEKLEKTLEKLEKLEKFGKTFLEKFGKNLEKLEKHFSKNSPWYIYPWFWIEILGIALDT